MSGLWLNVLIERTLPHELWYLVAEYSTFEVLVNLMRCNKWLHETCAPLLFQEIHLHTPTQLVKLVKSKRASGMLGKTKSMFLEEGLFNVHLWDAIGRSNPEEVPSYFITLLCTAVSLQRLHMLGRPVEGFITGWVMRELFPWSSIPTFLPKLEAIAGHRGISLGRLCENRPVKYLARFKKSHMTVDIYPSIKSRPTLFAPKQARELSPCEVGTLIRETKGSLLRTQPSLYLRVRSPEETRVGAGAPIPSLFAWLQEMIQVAELSSDKLRLFKVSFDPLPAYLSISAQFTVVTELHKLLPELERAVISHPAIEWKKHNVDGRLQVPPLAWTPRPYMGIPEVIDWWIDELNLSFTSAENYEEAQKFAEQLEQAMGRRYRLSEEFKGMIRNYFLDSKK